MRIAIVLGSLNRGGTETLLLDFFNNIEKSDLSVIGIYRKNGLLLNEFKNSGVTLHHLRPKSILDIFYLVKLRKLLLNNHVSIAHAQQPIDALSLWLACVGLDIKVILTLHGYDTKNILVLLNSIILKRTNLNIFVSKKQMKYYIKKYSLKNNNKRAVLYNGISSEKLSNFKYQSLREEFSLSKEILLIGSVGNFGSARDQMTICRFLNLLNQQGIDFNFIFIGGISTKEPWLFNNCVKYCKDNELDSKVQFLGVRSDIPNVLSQLEAFIYSSNHDTFGIAVIEAISMGIPVFVNDWEVMNEVTENGKYANIYKTKDEEDLLNKFKDYLDNKAQYHQNATINAEAIKKKYSIQNHINNLERIYRDLLN